MSEKIELQSEDNFRNTKNPKKRVKYLTEFCHDLLKKGNMVEAKYFVDKLIEINPNHPKALKLALPTELCGQNIIGLLCRGAL